MEMQRSTCDEEQYQKAAERAAAMLARRAMSAAMLERKLLEKDFCPEAVDYAVERMRILGAVNDTAYAEQLLRSCTRKGYGVLRIRQEMRHRGVPQEVIADVLEQVEPNWDAMRALLDKKLDGDVSDRRECEKAMAALQRRGFLFSEIREAMRDYRAEVAERNEE